VAIAAAYAVSAKSVTGSAAIYTVASTGYNRDLVVTNGGPSTLFVAFGTGASSAATTSSFAVPTGGSLVLTECQALQSGIIYGISAGTSATSVGWGTLVTVT
jgi:hypothetical protein